MIVFDLEWNQGREPDSLEEIIQIGAVRLDKLGGHITGTFNAYIRPVVHSQLSVGARHLPDLSLSLNADTTFLSVYQAFSDWCKGETSFASWGAQDHLVLEKNAAHWDIPPLPAAERLDLQAAFDRTVGASRCLSLESAVTYCGIPDVFSYHNALSDALYAALIGEHVSTETLYAPPPPKKHRTKRMTFTSLPSGRLPNPLCIAFPKRGYALDNLKLRRFACPVCGAPLSLAHWFPSDEQTYYGYFSCRADGRFLCRLHLKQTENRIWHAERAVLSPSEENIDSFYAARHNEPHHCKKSRRRKKKSWYFRRPRAAN